MHNFGKELKITNSQKSLFDAGPISDDGAASNFVDLTEEDEDDFLAPEQIETESAIGTSNGEFDEDDDFDDEPILIVRRFFFLFFPISL